MKVCRIRLLAALILLSFCGAACLTHAQESDDFEPISNADCADCHETDQHDVVITADLTASTHDGLECQDCHIHTTFIPHVVDTTFMPGCQGCRTCHEEQSEQYTSHGREAAQKCGDVPTCANCHGAHLVLPPDEKASLVHPTNLPETCGRCHEDLDMVKRHKFLLPHPVELYSQSIHGKSSKGGLYVAATCNDCHSAEGTAHKILSPDNPKSSINHFNIPQTCSKCHKGVTSDFWEGIHGQLVVRGETDAPVCTDCHGEHGIIDTDHPDSPVSKSRVAEATCAPCHESTTLNEKYGLPSGRLHTFIDSYHGLKSKAGDTEVANCASCHGVHRILPSSDSTSTVFPGNLRATCGECHPGISEKLAKIPIHGISGKGLSTPVADIIEKIYIAIIIVLTGFMGLHWFIDLVKQVRKMLKKPQVRRMHMDEVWQHMFLMVSFIVLVVSGFALRFSDSWIAVPFKMLEHGFQMRGVIHRSAAVVFMLTTLWHILFVLLSKRGRKFFRDMWPLFEDFKMLWQRVLYNLGRREEMPRFKRFSYIEKIEYWALIWGSVVMIVTGLMLWYDNYFINFLPKGFLDVGLVIHYWEAWLATLAIVIWHLYSTVYNPDIYPMNASWLTGTMTEEQYAHEHPAHLEEIELEEEQSLRKEMDHMATVHTPEEIAREVGRGESKAGAPPETEPPEEDYNVEP